MPMSDGSTFVTIVLTAGAVGLIVSLFLIPILGRRYRYGSPKSFVIPLAVSLSILGIGGGVAWTVDPPRPTTIQECR